MAVPQHRTTHRSRSRSRRPGTASRDSSSPRGIHRARIYHRCIDRPCTKPPDNTIRAAHRSSAWRGRRRTRVGRRRDCRPRRRSNRRVESHLAVPRRRSRRSTEGRGGRARAEKGGGSLLRETLPTSCHARRPHNPSLFSRRKWGPGTPSDRRTRHRELVSRSRRMDRGRVRSVGSDTVRARPTPRTNDHPEPRGSRITPAPQRGEPQRGPR
jgi:hypothetical protein